MPRTQQLTVIRNVSLAHSDRCTSRGSSANKAGHVDGERIPSHSRGPNGLGEHPQKNAQLIMISQLAPCDHAERIRPKKMFSCASFSTRFETKETQAQRVPCVGFGLVPNSSRKPASHSYPGRSSGMPEEMISTCEPIFLSVTTNYNSVGNCTYLALSRCIEISKTYKPWRVQRAKCEGTIIKDLGR